MILFISRKYPPSIGGMQRFSYHLNQELSQRAGVRPIVWGRSQLYLPLFLGYALLAGIIQLLKGRAQLIYLADALLAPLGLALKALSRRPLVVTAHGLDVTWDNALYQALIPACLRRTDKVICDSRYTEEECRGRGLAPERCLIIPLGVEPYPGELPPRSACRKLVGELARVNLEGKKVLLSVGRLVRRKGLAQFVRQVLTRVVAGCPSAHYIIVGEGAELPHIEAAIRTSGLEGKVSLLGRLPDRLVQMCYQAADLFVMPNLPVKGDVEGFGLVALEAAAAGLCVVASRVQGLLDAVEEGNNGYLVDPFDAERYAQVILELLGDDRAREEFARSAQRFTLERYSWARTADGYMAAFNSLLPQDGGTWHEAYLHTRRSLRRRRRRIRLFGLDKQARILELGCGDGLNLKAFRELGYLHLEGVDVSFFLLKRVREGQVVQADARHLPFRAHSYDVVYVDSVLHHLEDLPQALKELHRILAPQGLLCFIEPRASLARTILDRLTESPFAGPIPLLKHRQASLREESKLYRAWLKLEPSLQRLLEEHGFRPLLVHRDPLSLYGKYQKVDNGGQAGYNSR